MKKSAITLLILLSAFAAATSWAASLPALDHTLGNARATTSGGTLTVTTGAITQQWTLVPTGLATTSLVNPATGKEWCAPSGSAKIPLGGRRETPPNSSPSPNPKPPSGNLALPDSAPANTTCDWAFYGLLDGKQAKLLSLTATTDTDEGFADPHIRILAEFEYPDAATTVRYEIWAYPGANGLLTRLWFKGQGEKNHTKPKPPPNDIVTVRALGRKINFTPFSFNPPQPDWFNSVAIDREQPLNIALDNLDPRKTYKLALSFFNNITDQPLAQSVKLISGARATTLIDNIETKPYSKTKTAPQTIFVDIPPGALTRDTAKLVIANKNKTAPSMASEVIVYEKSPRPSIREIMFTHPARKPQLIAAAPAGYRLVGYGALGGKIGNLPTPPNGHLARLPIAAAAANTTRLYGGYFADTQNRDLRETPLLHEDTYTGPVNGTERVGWASFVALQDTTANEGLVLLKESHKCVNSFGCDTGDFTLDATSLTNTGLGLEAKDIVPDKYTRTWANWTILYNETPDAPSGSATASGSAKIPLGGRREAPPNSSSTPSPSPKPPSGNLALPDSSAAALAIKKFDRTRFHMLEPHLKMTANTWGTSTTNPRLRAAEENVLKEIAAAADIGIDGLCIDDGWQGNTYKNWRPAPTATFGRDGTITLYPDAWKNVCNAAAKAGQQLGIWCSEDCPLEDMIWNYDHGCFTFTKIDFVHMNDRARIDLIMQKARDYILHAGHGNVLINWDLTEIVPRVGVYSGREYGNLYLENRKPVAPAQTIYIPWLVLRDAWHISKYVNLNKVQISIQNLATIPAKNSNAAQHDQAYAAAIALMSSPLFFCEMQFFDEPARAKLRPLIAAWKRERDAMTRGYVAPIGSEPDDASWTGFQNCPDDENARDGYLLLFRELNNKQPTAAIALKNVANKTLRLTDLLTGETRDAPADAQGRATFTMEKPGDYRFYKYEIQ